MECQRNSNYVRLRKEVLRRVQGEPICIFSLVTLFPSQTTRLISFLIPKEFHLSLADHIQGISSEYILSFHLCSPMHSQYYSLTSPRRGISLPPYKFEIVPDRFGVCSGAPSAPGD